MPAYGYLSTVNLSSLMFIKKSTEDSIRTVENALNKNQNNKEWQDNFSVLFGKHLDEEKAFLKEINNYILKMENK